MTTVLHRLFSRAAGAAICALIALVLASTAARAELIDTFKSGPWNGEVWAGDDGKFNFCSGSAGYRSGIDLTVIVDHKYNWSIALWKKDWNYRQTEGEVRIRYNNGTWLKVRGAAKGNFIWLYMPTSETDVELFKSSRILDVQAFGMSPGFDLDGTRKLMDALVECVTARLALESPAAPDTTSGTEPSYSKPAEPSVAAGSGSGFYVSSQGYVVTNQHVVANCKQIQIVGSGASPATAELLRIDQVNDLALLKADISTPVTAAQLRVSRVRVGEQVAVFGYPLRGTLSASGNVTSGNISALAGLGDDVRHFQISAPIQPGNSGGPLLDFAGNVIGITSAKLNEINTAKETGTLPQNVNFAIKSNVVSSFLDAHSIDYSLAGENTPQLSLPDVAERARSFTVQVLCN